MKIRRITHLFYSIAFYNAVNVVFCNTIFCSIVFTAIFTDMSVFNRAVFAEDDWGPQLSPPAPMRYKHSAESNTAEDTAGGTDEGLPNRIALRSESLPLLPLPPRVKKRTVKPVQFDRTLEPQEMILPSGFLEEDTAAKVPSVPKPVKKTASNSPAKSLETGNIVSGIAAPLNSDKNTSDSNVYYDNEYIVNSDTVSGTGAEYSSNPAAYASGYAGEPIIYPFGTGWLDNLTLFAGTRAFKSEMDAANTGNFGFDEGFNWSAPVNSACNVSAQFGFRAVQADIKGNLENGKSSRNQYFLTAGAFRRDLCSTYQGGAAFDWYHDDLYGTLEVQQVRAELSVRTFSNTEYGFQGSFGLNKDSNTYLKQRENYLRATVDVPYSVFSDNSYQLFIRKHLFNSGIAEGRAGATEHGAFILSGSGEFPLNDSLALKGSFRTMLPKESRYSGGFRRESWDISVGIVYYFRGGGLTKVCNPCRPMFDVADSGSYFNRIK